MPAIRLGLRANWRQFWLLVAVNALLWTLCHRLIASGYRLKS